MGERTGRAVACESTPMQNGPHGGGVSFVPRHSLSPPPPSAPTPHTQPTPLTTSAPSLWPDVRKSRLGTHGFFFHPQQTDRGIKSRRRARATFRALRRALLALAPARRAPERGPGTGFWGRAPHRWAVTSRGNDSRAAEGPMAPAHPRRAQRRLTMDGHASLAGVPARVTFWASRPNPPLCTEQLLVHVHTEGRVLRFGRAGGRHANSLAAANWARLCCAVRSDAAQAPPPAFLFLASTASRDASPVARGVPFYLRGLGARSAGLVMRPSPVRAPPSPRPSSPPSRRCTAAMGTAKRRRRRAAAARDSQRQRFRSAPPHQIQWSTGKMGGGRGVEALPGRESRSDAT